MRPGSSTAQLKHCNTARWCEPNTDRERSDADTRYYLPRGPSMNVATRPAAALLLFLFPSAPAAADDWPQWQGPNRDSMTAETGLLKAWPEPGPERAWLFKNCGSGYAGFAIVGDRLYTMGGRDEKCQLIALDANTGQELWSADMGPMLQNDWGDG